MLAGSAICHIGGGSMTGQFTVDPAAADGLHNLVVTPSDGVAEGAVPFANVFQKVSAPTIFIVSPAFGLPGFGTIGAARVMVTGGGFATSASARSCDLLSLSPGAGPLFATTPATSCSISSAGTVTGTFAVSKTAVTGAYVVRVRDSGTGGTGWVADAPFAVSPLPGHRYWSWFRGGRDGNPRICGWLPHSGGRRTLHDHI